MTASWPPADLPGLHIDLGHWSPAASAWLRYPTADYRCSCGWSDSASGDAVPAFVATARRTHLTNCPHHPPPKESADGPEPA